MRFDRGHGGAAFILIAAVGLLFTGCAKEEKNGAAVKDNARSKTDGNAAQVADKGKSPEHGSWWCDEHGVPEEVYAQCNGKLAAEFKKKGDWCKEHDRPESQCFVCNPKLKDKFAAQYRAKYGKEPPPTEDEQNAAKDEKGKAPAAPNQGGKE